MGTTFAAIFYVSVALVAAYFLRPRFADSLGAARGMIFWLTAAPLLFLIFPISGALAASAVLVFVLAPKNADDRSVYYLVALFAAPVMMSTQIPFPGINYLIGVNFPMIAALLLLAPAIFLSRPPAAARYAPTAGVFIILLVALVSIQFFRTENLTAGLRGAVEFSVLFVIPYMALIRLAPDVDKFDKVVAGFLILGLICSCLAIVSEAAGWNFYLHLTERHGMRLYADIREGLLRVTGTVNPMLLGFIAALGLLGIEYFRIQKKSGMLAAWFYRAVFLLAALFTYSRGAWLAALAALATFYFFTRFPRGLRPIMIVINVVVFAPAALYYLMRIDLDRIDRFGTFEYRRDLLNASFVQIRQHPIFGDPNYLDSGNFDHLLQGQGIIDIVNYYLQITLEHGVVGFSLFTAAFLSVIIGLMRLGKIIRRTNDVDLERKRAVMLAALVSYLVLIVTVSGVSLIPHTGVMLLAFGAALLASARKKYATAQDSGTASQPFDPLAADRERRFD